MVDKSVSCGLSDINELQAYLSLTQQLNQVPCHRFKLHYIWHVDCVVLILDLKKQTTLPQLNIHPFTDYDK